LSFADERISHPPYNDSSYRFFVYKFTNLKSIRVLIYYFIQILNKIENGV